AAARHEPGGPVRLSGIHMYDSHCHLTDDRFADDLPQVLDRAWEAGLVGITTIASDVADTRTAIELAATDDRIRCTAGIHPHAVAAAGRTAMADIRELLEADD